MIDPVRKKWSVLVYMAADAGDEKLRDAALLNLHQMKAVGSSDDVHVVAQADLPGEDTRRYIFPKITRTPADAQMDVIELNRNVNSADPLVLEEFLLWATKACPADNILFIIWGHGFGIDDFNSFPDPPSNAAAPRDLSLHLESSALQPLAASLTPGALNVFGAGSDAPSRSYLSNTQTANTLAKCKQAIEKTGQHLAIVAFDCCDMALLEVWFGLAAIADFGVASQFTIPYSGWSYDLLLAELLQHPQMSAHELCSTIVETYIHFCNTLSPKPVVTLSACDFSQTDTLSKTIKDLAVGLVQASKDKNEIAKIFTARNASPIFDTDGFIDLLGFCRQLQVNFPGQDIAGLCDHVCATLERYVTATLFAPAGTAKKISLSGGVSVWFPPWIQYPDAGYPDGNPGEKQDSEGYFRFAYPQTQFAVKTGWHLFLNSLLQHSR